MKRTQIIPQALQDQINAIEATDLIVAEVKLNDITINDVVYEQYIRIKDTIINLSDFQFLPKPKRILINTETEEEKDFSITLPSWNIEKYSVSAMIDNNGHRILVDTEYRDDNDELIETKQEPIHVNSLKYLTYLSKLLPLPTLYGKFLQQYIDDELEKDANFFDKL